MNLRIVTFVSMQEIFRHFDSEKHGDAPGVDKVRCKYTANGSEVSLANDGCNLHVDERCCVDLGLHRASLLLRSASLSPVLSRWRFR